ncbi:MAG TPA: helix-turn-helix domain-containing protein [Chloroflexota bacterium]
MAHYAPGSQTRALLDEKQRLAARLLAQGLTVTQICKQLRCSPYFVRQAREKLISAEHETRRPLLSA